MDFNTIENLVKAVAERELGQKIQSAPTQAKKNNSAKVGLGDYPLAQKRPELVNSPTGKQLKDITLESIKDNSVKPEDVRISGEVLELQAQIAEANGKKQFAMNLRRAAELTRIPDEKVLEIYDLMRPNRATKAQLLDIAKDLESKYSAFITAKLVREAAEVYDQRNILKKD